MPGLIHGGYSSVTNYPLGVRKLLPYKTHLALDAVGALALASTLFVTGRFRRGAGSGAAPGSGFRKSRSA
jgi:2-methylaconitate cis-trans-isomerase PrpF